MNRIRSIAFIAATAFLLGTIGSVLSMQFIPTYIVADRDNLARLFSDLLAIGSFGLAAVTLGWAMLRYLGTRSGKDDAPADNSEAYHLFVDQLRQLAARQRDIDERLTQIDIDDKSGIIAFIKDDLQKDAARTVLQEIEGRVKAYTATSTHISTLQQLFHTPIKRLDREISALAKRGNLNLVIGVLGSVIGLGIILYYMSHPSTEHPTTWFFAAQQAPRLGLVVFIQLLSYFFLRLYKSSLDEIKYYQNELTNLEARLIAIGTAVMLGHDDVCKSTLQHLGKTERNHILEKGQTTTELEKARLEIEHVIGLTRKFAGDGASEAAAKSKS